MQNFKSFMPSPFQFKDIPLYAQYVEEFSSNITKSSNTLPSMTDAIKFFLEYDDTEFAKCQLQDYVEGIPYILTDNDYRLIIEYESTVDLFKFTLESVTNTEDAKFSVYYALDLLDSIEFDHPSSIRPFCQLLRRIGFWDI